MKQCDKQAYLAGLIDGEGSVAIVRIEHPTKRKKTQRVEHKARLSIINTDKKMIDWCVENFGGFLHKRKIANPRWKPCYSWNRSINKNDREWLISLSKYLITKKDRVQMLIDFIDLIGTPRFETPPEIIEQRENLRKEVLRLNDSGRAATTTKRSGRQ